MHGKSSSPSVNLIGYNWTYKTPATPVVAGVLYVVKSQYSIKKTGENMFDGNIMVT